MIAIVDSGVANLASVLAALGRLGAESVVTADPKLISAADRVILPGVGAAAAAMANLRQRGLTDLLPRLTQPVMGICLGMQMLFSQSAEGEELGQDPVACLDIIRGKVVRLTPSADGPIPHMGWNQIQRAKGEHPLMRDVQDGSFVYYVHSFAAPVADYTVASTSYGDKFTAIVGVRNFFGCQFHPERSGAIGNQILKNFLEL